MHLKWGTFCEGTRPKLYEKEQASSNNVKPYIQRMAFKGTDALFAVKEYSHTKLQRHKGQV